MDRASDEPKFLIMRLSVGGESLNPVQAFKWETKEVSLISSQLLGIRNI
jgi:hypothetical protein